MPVPWKSFMVSLPVYMIIVAQWGGGWGLFTLMTQAPTYFSVILGLNIKMVSCFYYMYNYLIIGFNKRSVATIEIYFRQTHLNFY